ncbi:MAG: dTMP kinase, partial [bacterium]
MGAEEGKIIALEGIDGSGKTTQAQRLTQELIKRGFKVELFRQPGGTELGENLRTLLLNYSSISPEGSLPLHPVAELFLFAADRAQLMYERVIPLLKKGWWIVLDRGVDSSIAYQGGGRGVNRRWVKVINSYATGNRLPHLTILLDLPVEKAFARITRKTDRIENNSKAFYQKVRKSYLELAHQNPHRFVVVDASLPLDQVFQRIWEAVESRLLHPRES